MWFNEVKGTKWLLWCHYSHWWGFFWSFGDEGCTGWCISRELACFLVCLQCVLCIVAIGLFELFYLFECVSPLKQCGFVNVEGCPQVVEVRVSLDSLDDCSCHDSVEDWVSWWYDLWSRSWYVLVSLAYILLSNTFEFVAPFAFVG